MADLFANGWPIFLISGGRSFCGQASKVRLADKTQLLEKTGCSFGELHPFATIFDLPLLFDEDFLKEDEVFINAGQLDYSVVVSPAAIVKAENPLLF